MVAAVLEPSVDLVVGLLGVLHAGAGYLLLDPSRAPGDAKAMVADAGAGVVLVQSGVASKVTAAGVPVLVLEDADEARRPRLASVPESRAPRCGRGHGRA